MNPKIYDLKMDVSCEASVNFHHISQNATPAMDLHIATTWRSFDNAIHKKHATRLVQSAAPATQNDYGSLQSAAPATKNAPRLLKTMRKYCPYHTERLPTHCETCWNVTKCHACHTKQGYATFETSKGDYFCTDSEWWIIIIFPKKWTDIGGYK